MTFSLWIFLFYETQGNTATDVIITLGIYCWPNAGPISGTLDNSVEPPDPISHLYLEDGVRHLMEKWCWAIVYDAGPTLVHRWVNAACFLASIGCSDKSAFIRLRRNTPALGASIRRRRQNPLFHSLSRIMSKTRVLLSPKDRHNHSFSGSVSLLSIPACRIRVRTHAPSCAHVNPRGGGATIVM